MAAEVRLMPLMESEQVRIGRLTTGKYYPWRPRTHLVLMMLVAKNKLLGHKSVKVKYLNFDKFNLKEYK